MLDLTATDKFIIEKSYQSFLQNLKSFLEHSTNRDALEYAKKIIKLLHQGQLSMLGKITFSDSYNYLYLPSIISIGTQITCGICCCRHATTFLNEILNILGYNTSLMYIKIDEQQEWHNVPPLEANHIVILLSLNNKDYIIDPANNFILLKEKDGTLIPLDIEIPPIINYQDSNINEIGQILKKYYLYRDLGIKHVYQ